jgi:hypothetical protein
MARAGTIVVSKNMLTTAGKYTRLFISELPTKLFLIVYNNTPEIDPRQQGVRKKPSTFRRDGLSFGAERATIGDRAPPGLQRAAPRPSPHQIVAGSMPCAAQLARHRTQLDAAKNLN